MLLLCLKQFLNNGLLYEVIELHVQYLSLAFKIVFISITGIRHSNISCICS